MVCAASSHQVEDVVHRVISWWMWSRSIGVMKVLCSSSMRVVGDLVGLLFDAFDRMHADFQVVEIGHQRDHFLRALDAQVGMLVEQLEKFALGGHQSSKHGRSSLVKLNA